MQDLRWYIFCVWIAQLGTPQLKVNLSLFCSEHLSTNGSNTTCFPYFWDPKNELKPSRQEPAEVLPIFVSSFERSDIGGVTPPTELPDGSFLVTWCWMFGQRKAISYLNMFLFMGFCVFLFTFSDVWHTEIYVVYCFVICQIDASVVFPLDLAICLWLQSGIPSNNLINHCLQNVPSMAIYVPFFEKGELFYPPWN